MIRVESSNLVDLTPELMAKAFWGMTSQEQAAFFEALHDAVSSSENAPCGLGEMQWCYMAADIKEHSKKAWEMFLAFSAFAYDFWPQKS